MPLGSGDAAEIEKDPNNLGGWLIAFNLPVLFRWPFSGAAGSGANFADGETPVGTIDGVNRTFTLAQTPVPATSVHVYSDNVRVNPSEYTVSGTQLVFAAGSPYIPLTELFADYRW